jgi:hypothetical protein
MSELKGQMLGMILVLAIFGAISAILIASFKNEANSVSERVNSLESSVPDSTAKAGLHVEIR